MAGGVFWADEYRLRSVWRWFCIAVVAASLLVWSVTGSEFGPEANAAGGQQGSRSVKTAKSVKGAVKKVGSRPDVTSAAVSARAQGSPVEVESMRSEFTSTFANPDGTLTLRSSTGQQRFRDEKGRWQKIGLEPEAVGGQLVVEDSANQLVFAGSSKSASGAAKARTVEQGHVAEGFASEGADVVTATPGRGREVTVGWGRPLGVPKVDGSTVMYPGADGVDVRVKVTRSGYKTFFLVKDRAAAQAAVAQSGSAKGRVAFDVPVRTKGLTARSENDGSVSFVDAKDKVVSRMVAPAAWDAAVDEASGLPKSTTGVRLDVAQKGKSKAVITASVDAKWALDQGRSFPLTVDPTYSTAYVKPSLDTRVQSDGGDVDYSTDDEIRVGTFNGGGVVARGYLNFPLASISGKDVVSASLSLYNYYSYSCTATTMNVTKTGIASTATRWDNQPTSYGVKGSASFAKGYSSSCAAGRQSIGVTGLVREFAGSGWVNGSVGLVAASETDSKGWKRFRSSETSTPPTLVVTYNRAPNVSAAPTFTATNTYNGVGYRISPRVNFYAVATDPDASQVKHTIELWSAKTGGTKLGSCTTSLVASGGRAVCEPPADVPNLATSYVRAKAMDERGVSASGWSAWTAIRRVADAPSAPSVSCPGFADGSWSDQRPGADVTCTISTSQTGMAAPTKVEVFVDGASTPTKTIAANQVAGSTTVTFKRTTDGGHDIRAVAVGPTLKTSTRTHAFGWGGASLLTPEHKATTSGEVTVSASGPPRGSASSVTGTVRWRVAGESDEATGWTIAEQTPVSVSSTSTGMTKATAVWDTQSAIEDAAGTKLPERSPVLLDVQICLTYGTATQCTWSQSAVTLSRVPHAFGDGYPVATAGPGQVAQYTGELNLSETDASVPGLASELSVGRSHLSFAGDGTLSGWPSADPAAKVFGPGFVANWTGPEDAGTGSMQVVDNTDIDGTMVLVDEEGYPLVWRQPGKERVARKTGTYTPATDDTVDAAMKLVVSGTGTQTRVVVTDEDGTVTTYAPTTTPSSGEWQWGVEKVAEPGAAGTTTYTRDGQGRVTRILAGLPDTYTTADCPATGTMKPGCRALTIAYATSTTATATAGGDVNGQVKQISSVLWDPNTSAMKTTVLATYVYAASGRLLRVTDPRTGLLISNYGWSGSTTRLASLTPPGQAAYRFAYETAGDGGGKGARVKQVTRDAPASGGSSVALASFVYDLDPAAADGPGLGSSTVGQWFQASKPTAGFAVFGPDHPVSSTTALAAGDWKHADLSFTDAQGYEVNTAEYGAGQWLLTATDYDAHGNEVRSLDANGINALRASPPEDKSGADWYSTQKVYNDDILATDGTVAVPEGTLLLHETGPGEELTLPDGAQVTARVRESTTYDQGAPNGGVNPATGARYNLPTRVVTSAVGAGADETDVELTSTDTGYDPIEPGDPSGWDLGAETSTTTGGITRTTRLDSAGRIIETRQPSATSSKDAGTSRTIYYTAGPNSADSGCGSSTTAKAFVGLVCKTKAGAAPSAGPAIPTEHTTGYDMYGSPVTVVETSGSVTRTSTTRYDVAGREVFAKTTSTIPGSSPVSATFTKYDSSTGLVAYSGEANSGGTDATSARVSMSFDRWGRQVSYTNEDGQAGTTAYDDAGRVSSFADPKGSTTFTYDGTDAAGKAEFRGLPTKATVSRPGGNDLVFTGAYDATGGLARQVLPGGITAVSERNVLGQEVGMSYAGQVTPVTATTDPDTGETTWEAGAPTEGDWLTWTVARDGLGRIAREFTPGGAAFSPDPEVTDPVEGESSTAAVGRAFPYDRAYTYDGAGRLTKVTGRKGVVGGPAGLSPEAEPTAGAPCQVRAYAFDGAAGRNGARTGMSVTNHVDGDCAGVTGASRSVSQLFDTADRPVSGLRADGEAASGAYAYDGFGRQITVPGGDTPAGVGAGALTLGYFDTDLPALVTQDGFTTEFTLDSQGRRATQTTSNETSLTGTTVRHYTDDSDNPSWVSTTKPGQAEPSMTRFVDGLSAELGAMVTGTGDATVSLSNPHGDVVTSVEVPATQASSTSATALTGWEEFTEYGLPAAGSEPGTQGVGGPVGYGWLGAHERSTTPDTAGLTLMGVRYYNPVTGAFTSPDPVAGGNTTAYTYPNDPINELDLDGEVCFCSAGKGPSSVGRAGGPRAGTRGTGSGGRHYDRQVPRAQKSRKTIRKRKYWGYTVYHKSSRRVYKYGITRVRGSSRPRVALRRCKSYFGSSCWYKKRVVTNSYYRARRWERSKIIRYKYRHGQCPPGQRRSCK